MARNPKAGKKTNERRPKPGAAGGRPRKGRPKICIFCAEHATWVDYKDVTVLRRFVNDRGRIKSRGATGTCAQHQRDVAIAVKTARELALMPYSIRASASESRGSRGGDRRGGGRGPAAADSSESETSEESPGSEGRADEADETGESDDTAVGEAADSAAEVTT